MEDSRRVVNELAGAFRDKDGTFLLTITLKSQEMFGVAPLTILIERITQECTDDRRKRKEGLMPLFMMLWERAYTYFNEYLIKSPEKPLGTIIRISPRFEF